MTDNYSETDKFRCVSDEQIKSIIKATELSLDMKAQAEKYKKLSSLCDEELAYTIRHSVSYPWFDFFAQGAIKWLDIISKKYDKRKKYAEQSDYDLLTRQLRDAFGEESLKIVNITTYGWDSYGYRVDFVIASSDHIFLLDVPNIKITNTENMEYFKYGQLKFGYKASSCVYKFINDSYNLRDFRATMLEIKTVREYEKHYSKVDAGYGDD